MYIGVLSPQRGLPSLAAYASKIAAIASPVRMPGRSRGGNVVELQPHAASVGSRLRSSRKRSRSTFPRCRRARSGMKNDSSGIAIPGERSRTTRSKVVPERLTPRTKSGDVKARRARSPRPPRCRRSVHEATTYDPVGARGLGRTQDENALPANAALPGEEPPVRDRIGQDPNREATSRGEPRCARGRARCSARPRGCSAASSSGCRPGRTLAAGSRTCQVAPAGRSRARTRRAGPPSSGTWRERGVFRRRASSPATARWSRTGGDAVAAPVPVGREHLRTRAREAGSAGRWCRRGSGSGARSCGRAPRARPGAGRCPRRRSARDRCGRPTCTRRGPCCSSRSRTSLRTRRPSPSSMSTVTVPLLRSTNEMTATLRAHSHTGEKTRSTFVPVIGLRSSFTRSVNANAAAVAPSRARTISSCGSRVNSCLTETRGCAPGRMAPRARSRELVPWNSAVARIARSLRGCGYSRRSVS